MERPFLARASLAAAKASNTKDCQLFPLLLLKLVVLTKKVAEAFEASYDRGLSIGAGASGGLAVRCPAAGSKVTVSFYAEGEPVDSSTNRRPRLSLYIMLFTGNRCKHACERQCYFGFEPSAAVHSKRQKGLKAHLYIHTDILQRMPKCSGA